MIPVACKLFLRDHPEVNYKPGPFNPGRRLGAVCNVIAISWTCFAVTILVSLLLAIVEQSQKVLAYSLHFPSRSCLRSDLLQP